MTDLTATAQTLAERISISRRKSLCFEGSCRNCNSLVSNFSIRSRQSSELVSRLRFVAKITSLAGALYLLNSATNWTLASTQVALKCLPRRNNSGRLIEVYSSGKTEHLSPAAQSSSSSQLADIRKRRTQTRAAEPQTPPKAARQLAGLIVIDSRRFHFQEHLRRRRDAPFPRQELPNAAATAAASQSLGNYSFYIVFG